MMNMKIMFLKITTYLLTLSSLIKLSNLRYLEVFFQFQNVKPSLITFTATKLLYVPTL